MNGVPMESLLLRISRDVLCRVNDEVVHGAKGHIEIQYHVCITTKISSVLYSVSLVCSNKVSSFDQLKILNKGWLSKSSGSKVFVAHFFFGRKKKSFVSARRERETGKFSPRALK